MSLSCNFYSMTKIKLLELTAEIKSKENKKGKEKKEEEVLWTK